MLGKRTPMLVGDLKIKDVLELENNISLKGLKTAKMSKVLK